MVGILALMLTLTLDWGASLASCNCLVGPLVQLQWPHRKHVFVPHLETTTVHIPVYGLLSHKL